MRRLLPQPLRRGLRRVRGAAAAGLGLPLARAVEALLRRTSLRAGVVLVYHRVGDPPGDPGRELNPALGTELFESQLAHLSRRYRVVAARDLPAAVERRRRCERFPVAITFDDDDHTHPSVAARLLGEAGLTATFFVNAESLDGPRPLWWQQLQRAWDEDALDAEVLALVGLPPDPSRNRLALIGAAITQLRPEQRERVRAALRDRVGDDAALDGLSRGELRDLADGGFELGCHTQRHDFLPMLTPEELAESVTSGRAEVEEVAGGPVRVFAYPSGGWDAAARDAVERAGYVAVFTAHGGVVTPHSDRLALPRVSPPTGHVAEFSYVLASTLWERGPQAGAAS
jgi:peptidoglycan/xylan/chitin deacetylase (PgdA/CDA1 family)